MSDSVQPQRRQPTRLLRPWDSPGKNTGVGCYFLLQCMKVKSLSHVRLFAIPWTAAYQSPPSMGFFRQEYWSGVPLPSPMHESEVAQSCLTLSNPMGYSLPGSSVHGIFDVLIIFTIVKRRSRQGLSLTAHFSYFYLIFPILF